MPNVTRKGTSGTRSSLQRNRRIAFNSFNVELGLFTSNKSRPAFIPALHDLKAKRNIAWPQVRPTWNQVNAVCLPKKMKLEVDRQRHDGQVHSHKVLLKTTCRLDVIQFNTFNKLLKVKAWKNCRRCENNRLMLEKCSLSLKWLYMLNI